MTHSVDALTMQQNQVVQQCMAASTWSDAAAAAGKAPKGASQTPQNWWHKTDYVAFGKRQIQVQCHEFPKGIPQISTREEEECFSANAVQCHMSFCKEFLRYQLRKRVRMQTEKRGEGGG